MPGQSSRRWQAPAAVFVLVAAAFLGALRNEFVWDDWRLIASTYGYRQLDWRHLRWMFTARHVANFCPLAWFSYALDYKLWGLNAVGYHLTNVVLHAFNALAFFFVARRLLALSTSAEGRRLELAAAFSALAFGLHPLRAESVAWASERRDVLAGLFFLLTILSYLRAAAEPKRRGRWLAASLGAYALAGLSKATVAPLPAALLALDVYPLRRLDFSNPRRAAGILMEKAPFAAISAAVCVLALLAQSEIGNLAGLSQHDLGGRLAQSLLGLGFYLRKEAWPSGLAVLYPLPPSLSLWSAGVAASLAILAAAAALLYAAGVSARAQAALWLYYVGMLLPVLGLVQNGPQLVALRYSYLSCLGWALLPGAVVAGARRGVWAAVVLGLLLMAATVRTQAELAVWSSDVTAWGAQIRLFPDSLVGRLNLAAAYNLRGDRAAAEREAREALRLDPQNAVATYNLAQALEATGRLEEARVLAVAALREREWGEAHGLLGHTLLQLGRRREALVHLTAAVALSPNVVHLQYLLGQALLDDRRPREALVALQTADRMDPGNALYERTIARAREQARTAP